jgi:hypothetical protein
VEGRHRVSRSDSNDLELKSLSRNGSEEHIIGTDENKPGPLKINVTTVYALADDKRDSTPKDQEESEVERKLTGIAKSRVNPFRGRGKAPRILVWGGGVIVWMVRAKLRGCWG